VKSDPKPAVARTEPALPRIFAGLFGAFLGLSLLKFGNPPIMEKWVSPPADIYEFLLASPWPIAWAYWLLGMIGVVGLLAACRIAGAPRWLLALPLIWLLWQFLAGAQSVDAELARATLKHFTACVVCFYLGFFPLGRIARPWPFWIGLLLGFALVVAVGWEQHFGGLAESRRYFFTYVYPHLAEVPPGYLQKMASNRIFSTLFYPNALAGVLLLLLPASLATIWQTRPWLSAGARRFLIVTITVAALGCLYWSGSKGGWLLMLWLGLVALLRLRLGKPFKAALLTAVLLAGLAGFFWRYSAFFHKGATSVSARFDYWRAALQTAKEKPIFGTGPGTFAIPYQKIKRPEAEMSRLVHNDYLEQATDSGVPGLLTYVAFIVGALVWSYPQSSPRSATTLPPRPRSRPPPRHASDPPYPGTAARQAEEKDENEDETARGTMDDWQTFSVWLGVLGWSLQGLLEFGLYIPALAWPAFALFGRLSATKWAGLRPDTQFDNEGLH
jgi:O-antigen ligase